MTTTTVPTVTEELVAELDMLSGADPQGAFPIRSVVILALLAERAELKLQLAAASVDAERYRYVRSRSLLDGINLQIDANDSNGKQSTIIARWNLADELIDAARSIASD